jgi:hypothetical protein
MTIERFTTGDFIDRLSRFDPVLVELAPCFVAACICELAFCFGHAMSEPLIGSAFCALSAQGPFAGYPQIDDLTHAIARR